MVIQEGIPTVVISCFARNRQLFLDFWWNPAAQQPSLIAVMFSRKSDPQKARDLQHFKRS
jgi:hypothetical protein